MLFELIWLSAASLTAGVVYGFAGFGAALVFMPLAVIVVDPLVAVVALSVSALSSLVTLVPQAWRQADRRAAVTMLAAAFAFIPLGQIVLTRTDITLLRWAVCILALLTLVILLSGFRYQQRPGVPAWLLVGSGVGFMGGSTGLNGPLLILFQLGGPEELTRLRATTIIVLTCSGLAYLPFLALNGALTSENVFLGSVQLLPYGLGTLIGQRLFQPGMDVIYRRVAYVIIGVSALLGLPVWT